MFQAGERALTPSADLQQTSTHDPRRVWLGTPAPRYTSYPPATQFRLVPAGDMPAHLDDLRTAGQAISLYVHIPFCPALCLFCGCHSVITNRADRATAYLTALHREIALVRERLGERLRVAHLHFGGGSPSTLLPDQLRLLMQDLRTAFAFEPTAELAIELDPRTTSPDLITTLAEQGFNRASLGVQDFDPAVQQLIHRVQPFELVQEVMERLRGVGLHALSLDLMYGLPGQTPDSVAATARQVLELAPARVSLFSYAHVPAMKPYQKKLEQAGLPDDLSRLDMEQAARAVLEGNGFDPVGMDHFARPDDPLAEAARAGRLSRNFQGYTDDPADLMLGLGASAISDSGTMMVQNDPDLTVYQNRLARGDLPLKRACPRTAMDRVRNRLIHDLMCRFAADVPADLQPEPGRLEPFLASGLVRWNGRTLTVDTRHRMAVRAVATAFDPTFNPGKTASRVA